MEPITRQVINFMKTLFTILFLFFAGTAFGQRRDTTRHFVPPIHSDTARHHWDTTKRRDTTGFSQEREARQARHQAARLKQAQGYANIRTWYASQHIPMDKVNAIIARDSVATEAARKTNDSKWEANRKAGK